MMINPIGETPKLSNLKKNQTSSKNEHVLPHSNQTSIEDQVNLSPEALEALQVRKWVQDVKAMTDIREDQVNSAQQKIQQADYFEIVAENLSQDIASLFLGADSSVE